MSVVKNINLKVAGMTFGLHNIEVYERLSEETLAFACDIYINDSYIGTCENNGKGEGNFPRIYGDNERWELYNKVESEVVKHTFKLEFSGKTIERNYSMDFLIGDMIYLAHYENKKVYKFEDER